MSVESAADLAGILRQHRLLEPVQLDQLPGLQGRHPDSKALAHELLERGWLTEYQVTQLLQDRGAELVMGQYVVLDRLGEGGMGTVFKARQRRLKRLAALKVIRKENLTTAGAVQRFHREAEAAARLAHPNIVAVYDADEANGTHFLAMEYIEGVDLARLVKQRGPLPVDEACDYMCQAALGLQHAHEAGLVHRDIKPGNLLVTQTTRDRQAVPHPPILKILDMGLARMTAVGDDDDYSGTLTQEGLIVGTLDFLAPEQAEDSHHVDIRADLYSLGCTFYLLLAGKAPFTGGSAPEKLMKHRLDEAAPIEKLRPDVPAEVAAIVKKLMAKKPADRFQTPVEVAAALARVPSVATSAAPQLSPAAAGPRSMDAEPRTEGMGSVSASASIPATLDRGAAEDRSSDTPSEAMATAAGLALPRAPKAAVPTAPKGRRWVLVALGALVLLGGAVAVPLMLNNNPQTPDTGSVAPPPLDVPQPPPMVRNPPPGPEKPWQPGPAENVLRGLAPRPASLPGIGRWQLETAAPRGEVRAVAWSPDSKRLAFACETGEVRIYDAQTRKLAGLLVGHSGPVTSVAWSRDGKQLASGSRDKTVRLWQADGTPGAVLRQRTHWIQAVAWSPDGKRLASADYMGVVRIWDADGKPGPILKGHTATVESVAWSPDGKQLASGSRDQTVRLWHAGGTAGPVLKGHTAEVSTVAWNPYGKRLASASKHKTVRLWEVDGKPGPLLKGHLGAVSCVAWSPDGKQLVSIGHGADGIRLWRADGTPGPVLKGHGPGNSFVAWSPDGKQFATTGGDCTVRLWQANGVPGPAFEGHKGLRSVAWTADGLRLASGGDDWTVRLWSADGVAGPVLKDHSDRVYAVAWSPENKQLASASGDRTVRLYDADGTPGPVLNGHIGGALCVAWAPDGKQLASGGRDQTVRLWTATGTAGPVLQGHTGDVNAAAWDRDGKRLASASSDQTVRLWHADGTAGPVLKADVGVTGVAWSSDNRHLAAVGSGGGKALWLWDTDGKEAAAVKPPYSLVAVAWSPDSQRLATASTGQEVRLWQTDGNAGPALPGHTAMVRSVSWSRSGRIASCGDDATIHIWDAASVEPREVIVPLLGDQAATFSAAGELRHGDPAVVEKEFVCVVEQPGGRLEVVKPSEFHKQRRALLAFARHIGPQSPMAPWQPGSADDVLRGLAPRPAALPGVKRWQVETVAPHGEVTAVAWNPKQRLLACGTATGEVRLYDTETLHLVHLLLGHTDRVSSVAWSPNGQQLASGSRDNTVRLWQADGTPGPVLKGHKNYVYAVAWAPDGTRLASGGNDGTVRLWGEKGSPGPVWNTVAAVNALAWSPDGNRLATGHYGPHEIRVWSLDGAPGPILKGHTGAVQSVAWSPDGKRLASVSLDGTVRLWSADGKEGPVLKGPGGYVNAVAWSPDGKRLAAGGNGIKQWWADGKEGPVLPRGPAVAINSVAWSPDSQRLAAACGDRAVRLWTADGKPDSIIQGRTASLFSVAWSPDGQRLASGSADRTVRLWSADGKEDRIFKGHTKAVDSVSWSPDGQRLASGSHDNTVRLWSIAGEQDGQMLKGHTGYVRSVAWSPDGRLIASGSDDQTVRLWSADGKEGPVLQGQPSSVYSVAWSPDGQRLTAAGRGGTVRLWSADGKVGPVLQGPWGDVSSVAWDPNGRHVVMGGSGLLLWQADSKEGPAVLKGHSGEVLALAWSPDGQRFAEATNNQRVRFWQADGKPGPILRGHAAAVRGVSWSRSGRIASCGDDATIRLWDAGSTEPREVLVPLGDDHAVTFTGAGQLRDGDPGVIEHEFVYVVEQPDGRLELLRPMEFHARYAAGR